MDSRVEVCRITDNENVLDGNESLNFSVYLIDNSENELKVGDYSVSKTGAVICEIDTYLEQYKKEHLNKIQDVMLNNGLKEIMNLSITDDELFQELLADKYIFEADENRWQRANQYISGKDIEVQSFDMKEKISNSK